MSEPKEPKKIEEEEETAAPKEDELSDEELDTVSGADPGDKPDD